MTRISRTPLVTLFATIALLVVPSVANAGIIFGMESNGELANSSVTPQQRTIALDKMSQMGVKLVRTNWGWNEVATPGCAGQTLDQLKDPANACYDWTRLDDMVGQTKAHGMQLFVSFTRAPVFVLGNPDPYYMGATTAQFQIMKNHYAAFVTAAATRYKAGSPIGEIKYFTVWNEPGSNLFFKPGPTIASVKRYAELYGAAAVAIKTASPTALVGVGPTGPKSQVPPVPFIREFLKWAPKYLPGSMANKRKYINAWAHNPYPNSTMPPRYATPNVPATQIGMSRIDRLFNELDKSPLTKHINVWAAEFGYESKPAEPTYGVTLAKQWQYQVEGFHWLDSKKRVTLGVNYQLTDSAVTLTDWQSGPFTLAGDKKPLFFAFQRMISVPVPATEPLVRIKGDKFKRNGKIPVWGRSNIAPKSGLLAYKTTPNGIWHKVPGQKRAADGTINAMMKLSAPVMYFATYDAGSAALGIDAGYGPTRVIKTGK